MSNPGFQPYLDLTTAAKAAGGPGRYLANIRGTSLAVGAVCGIVGVTVAQAVADGKVKALWYCRVKNTHRPIQGTLVEGQWTCRDCGKPV